MGTSDKFQRAVLLALLGVMTATLGFVIMGVLGQDLQTIEAAQLARWFAFAGFCVFAILFWYLSSIISERGFAPWCIGWTAWGILAGLKAGAMSFPATQPYLRQILPILSLANSYCFLLAGIYFGWPHARPVRYYPMYALGVVALLTTFVAAFRIGGESMLLAARWVDGVTSLIVSVVLGLGFARKLERGAIRGFVTRTTGKATWSVAFLVWVFVCFGMFQLALSVRGDDLTDQVAVILLSSAFAICLGLILLGSIIRDAYDRISERLKGAEFYLDSGMRIIGWNVIAEEITGSIGSDLSGLHIGDVAVRFLTEAEDIEKTLRAGDQYGPAVLVCKRVLPSTGRIEESRRVVRATPIFVDSKATARVNIGSSPVPWEVDSWEVE